MGDEFVPALKPPTPDQLRAAGFEKYIGFERFVINRRTHPNYFASSWPIAPSLQAMGHERMAYRMPHLNYNSVLVAVISNDWLKDGWWRLQNMLRFTEEKGFTLALEEVDDPSIMPSDAIGMMRYCASMLALDAGFEWCFMVDTDVLLEEDTLVRLLEHDRPIVYPLIVDLEQRYPDAPIHNPKLKQGTGLKPVTWCTMSAMLFNTKVFNCLTPYAWWGHDYHFAQCLAHYGHRIYVDTDTVVPVSRGPTRNPSKDWDQYWKDQEAGWRRRATRDRDRRPPPDYDPYGKGTVGIDGVYWAMKNWDTDEPRPWKNNGKGTE